MGTRKRQQRQEGLWVAAADLPTTAGHPFYARLNQLLDDHGFDAFVEGKCRRFYGEDGAAECTTGSLFPVATEVYRRLLSGSPYASIMPGEEFAYAHSRRFPAKFQRPYRLALGEK